MRQADRGRDVANSTASFGLTEWSIRTNAAIHDRDWSDRNLPDPLAFQMAAAACARDNLARVIRPGLADGIDYVFDRLHAVSSMVCWVASGLAADELAPLVRAIDPPPAAWFVLGAPWSALRGRRALGRDVWERRGEAFARLVASLYGALDGAGGELELRIRLATGWGTTIPIDASGPPAQVADLILEHLICTGRLDG
jgi:thymidylate kinase